ncbi:MAG TPA: cupin domain-containing protein [Phycisphaerales bacterium]|nr:cupin domain-containing protein [Phycisphaerales bacterium]
MTTASFPQKAHSIEILDVVGEEIRVLADSSSTRGQCFIFEDISPPSGGPPLHTHTRDDEFFYILEGSVKFVIDGVESIARAGEFRHAPRGSIHAFMNMGPGKSRMLITCTPAGLETAFREVDALNRAGKMTPETLTAAFKKIELDIVGPPLSAMERFHQGNEQTSTITSQVF